MVAFQELTEAERSAFTRLMLSLLFRNPEAVADIKKHMLDVWNPAIDSLRDNYPQWRAETDPEDFADFVERPSPGARFMRVMNLLYESIDNPKVGNAIFQMCWSCVSLEEASGILLTSDRPLELANGLGSPNALITMPLGPKHLFVASHRDSRWLRNLAPAKIVEEVNKGVVARARKMVWGVDDARLDFVREWMSREPDRVLISPLQKREAIEAARGDGERELETVFPHHPARPTGNNAAWRRSPAPSSQPAWR